LSALCDAENAELHRYSILFHYSLDFHFGSEDTNPWAKRRTLMQLQEALQAVVSALGKRPSIRLSVRRAYIAFTSAKSL
jgi:hypothetical protein